MSNFEFKKDRVFGHGRNLALNSIVIGGRMTGRKDFVLWYLRQFWVRAWEIETHISGGGVGVPWPRSGQNFQFND